MDELVKLLRAKQKEKPDQPVVIAASKDMPYGEVVEIMDLLQRNQIRRSRLYLLHRLLSILCLKGFVTLIPEQRGKVGPNILFVIHDQNPFRAGHKSLLD